MGVSVDFGDDDLGGGEGVGEVLVDGSQSLAVATPGSVKLYKSGTVTTNKLAIY